ncbi:DNA mismatch repair protein MutS, partial [Candidatus Dojkabacteria bacterium]|nr:DNA mismatch repair protein MutS [Candidatus Dojkabacteria bacterium]
MTPMQEQYNKIKKLHQDAVLLFRLGDFYEAFNEDAELISEILGLTLTGRGKGETRIPMAGIPHHALSNYVPKLVEAGIKIAIADQVEEAVAGQLVDRQVTKIITSGTITDDSSLKAGVNNFIASVIFKDNNFYVAFTDITTGSLSIFETKSI